MLCIGDLRIFMRVPVHVCGHFQTRGGSSVPEQSMLINNVECSSALPYEEADTGKLPGLRA